MTKLKIKIGLEIHVQLATASKMFCRCDNQSFNKAPNTLVCPVCLGMPGALPVANKEAIILTIKTGLALNCTINKIAKFDRKHYFYPDLPKGYQISQYDEPFATKGSLKLKKSEKEEKNIRINRVHLEEDAGKLVHLKDETMVDLNRAGTPLMEIVTEPDISSPEEASDFLRKLQKIIRDEVRVSEASMEKGHMRCDANISMTDETGFMSPIVELKNINSFRFVEKALKKVAEKLSEEYGSWSKEKTKETWGYDSKGDKINLQRRKEEASDYRYFPEPDLPPFSTESFNLKSLKLETEEGEESKIAKLIDAGISSTDARVLVTDKAKAEFFESVKDIVKDKKMAVKAVIHNYFGFNIGIKDIKRAKEYVKAIDALSDGKILKHQFAEIADGIKKGEDFIHIFNQISAETETLNADQVVKEVLLTNKKEVAAYKGGKTQLLGFFIGETMKKSKGKLDPKKASRLIIEKLKD